MIIVENSVTKLLTMPITQLSTICKNYGYVLSVKDFKGVPDYMKSLSEAFPEVTLDTLRDVCRISTRQNKYVDIVVEYNSKDNNFTPQCLLKPGTLSDTNDVQSLIEMLNNLTQLIETLNNLL